MNKHFTFFFFPRGEKDKNHRRMAWLTYQIMSRIEDETFPSVPTSSLSRGKMVKALNLKKVRTPKWCPCSALPLSVYTNDTFYK